MNKTSRPLLAATISAIFATGAAHAQGMPEFKFSGFGTVAATHSSERNADFTTSLVQPNGAGATRAWSMNPDTRFGVQGDVKFSDNFSGVLQLVSHQRYNNNWVPQVEWANVKYQATPELSVRVGRTAMPYFMYSDTRLVGYAQPWVRPPVETYIVQPNTSVDGIDAMYRTNLAGFSHNLQAFYGVNKTRLAGGGEAKGKVNWGLNDSAQIGDLTLRAGFTYSKVDIPDLEALSGALGAFSAIPGPVGAESARLAAAYRGKDMDFRTLALGASYDPGKWFLTGEVLNFRGDSFVRGTRAWYLSGGYRFGSFTPYLTYAGTKNHTRQEAGIPFAPAAPLNAALNAVIGTTAEQNTLSLGLRWDFARNTDLKVQYDHVKTGAGSSGRLVNPTAAYVPGRSANLFTVAVDFVF